MVLRAERDLDNYTREDAAVRRAKIPMPADGVFTGVAFLAFNFATHIALCIAKLFLEVCDVGGLRRIDTSWQMATGTIIQKKGENNKRAALIFLFSPLFGINKRASSSHDHILPRRRYTFRTLFWPGVKVNSQEYCDRARLSPPLDRIVIKINQMTESDRPAIFLTLLLT